MTSKTYISAQPGQIYWRHERCPHHGAKVLLLTIGGVCVVGSWYGEPGRYFTAWSPMPKDGAPPPDIRSASLWERVKFAVRLVTGRL
jgi:hypothetical protein